MAIELKFVKPDSGSHWGFRLVGGADFNEPLVVVKVNENSFAEDAGLMVGDVIVRINNTATAGLTHAAAHDLINSAGSEFVMAIRRGLFSDIPVYLEDENGVEVETILKQSLADYLPDKDQEIGPSPTILENLAGQEQLIESTIKKASIDNHKTKKAKKLSTFLVKPKNPKPVCKKEEERKIIGEPYRVKIIKQPKRDPKEVLNHAIKKTVQFEPLVTEVELSPESSIADSNESLEIKEATNEAHFGMEDSHDQNHLEIGNADDEQNNDSDIDENTSQNVEKISEETKPIRIDPAPLDIHIDPITCDSLSLEQQLAAVQKQLLALSQLPSAIQVTLEAVTQQLNKIVLEKSNQLNMNDNTEINNNINNVEQAGSDIGLDEVISEMIDENVSISENAEGDITENETEDQQAVEDFDLDELVNGEAHTEETQEEKEPEIEIVLDPYAGLSEEEKEAKIKEEKLLAKKQKIEEQRRKMDWNQRPIVLPGGRKWTDPEDATPKLRTPKMSDEKICKTIEDYSEVIVGKTKGSRSSRESNCFMVPSKVDIKIVSTYRLSQLDREGFYIGINFLKYQPPPKNLDYLQKSEVYRLIHDMEPPVRGVGARAEKVLSERDYYGDKGAP